MFREGGEFRGALHAFATGGEKREAWLLFLGGEPVAGVGRDYEGLVLAEEALELAKELGRTSFTRLSANVLERMRAEASGTPAEMEGPVAGKDQERG